MTKAASTQEERNSSEFGQTKLVGIKNGKIWLQKLFRMD